MTITAQSEWTRQAAAASWLGRDRHARLVGLLVRTDDPTDEQQRRALDQLDRIAAERPGDLLHTARRALQAAPWSIVSRRGNGDHLRVTLRTHAASKVAEVHGVPTLTTFGGWQLDPGTPVLWRHDCGHRVGTVAAVTENAIGDTTAWIELDRSARGYTDLAVAAILGELSASPAVSYPTATATRSTDRIGTAHEQIPAAVVTEVSLVPLDSQALETCAVELGTAPADALRRSQRRAAPDMTRVQVHNVPGARLTVR